VGGEGRGGEGGTLHGQDEGTGGSGAASLSPQKQSSLYLGEKKKKMQSLEGCIHAAAKHLPCERPLGMVQGPCLFC
jgi:hypothetical protein